MRAYSDIVGNDPTLCCKVLIVSLKCFVEACKIYTQFSHFFFCVQIVRIIENEEGTVDMDMLEKNLQVINSPICMQSVKDKYVHIKFVNQQH